MINKIEEITFNENEEFEEPEEIDDLDGYLDDTTNIAFSGSPLYPRIFLGESSKPLNPQFNESSYVDDNIHRSYLGLMSFFG